MIKLSVCEAYALDYLAILMVKIENGIESDDARKPLVRDLSKQIGEMRFNLVRKSSAWNRLLAANRRVFALVEQAARNLCSAQDVEQANYERYLAKRELQERFWPDSPLDERKSARP